MSVCNAAMALDVMLDRMRAVSSSAAMPAVMQIHNKPLCCQLQTSPELWERDNAIAMTDRKHACAVKSRDPRLVSIHPFRPEHLP